MTLIEILNKINNNQSIDLNEIIYFITTTIQTFKGNINVDLIMKGINIGLINEMVKACINIISKNPDLFKIQEIILYSKQGNIIYKQYKSI